jgi:hypothetical protein
MKTKKDIILDEIFANDPYGILNTVEEDNRLIAEFMGFGNVGASKILYAVILDNKAIGYKSPEDLEFNTSWNWLMAVVDKIHDKANSVVIERMSCEIKYIDWFNSANNFNVQIASGVKMNAVYGAVIQFIKKYNLLKL